MVLSFLAGDVLISVLFARNMAHFTCRYGPYYTLIWLILPAKPGHIATLLQPNGPALAFISRRCFF